ncbi:MAG: hypothetical protein E7429_05685 [Ruminococcaceae bacterium]|nr:hypothetical protein [Oscillospiraceae bacterium]
MLSKRSFFNETLFRKNLTRFWPLWAAPSFVGALFPLAVLMELLRYNDSRMNALSVREVYYSTVTVAVPIISLIYAILVAVAVWSYLFNPRSTGMMHTLPIRREGLFITNFLSGMTMMAIPYVVTGALAVLVFSCFGGFEPVGLLVTILAVIAESLFYFASATVVAFITGNLFAMPVLYFIFHFLAVGMDALVCLFARGFLFGVSGEYTGAVEWLSPTVYLINHVRSRTEYTERFIEDANRHLGGYWKTEISAVTLENGWLIAVYALAGLALLGAAWLLYSRRSSESAGDVVSVGWMKPVFRWGVTICAALLGGVALYEIFWRGFQFGKYYDAVPMTVCMLISGAIGYYAASMLLAKSLRVFRGSLKGLAATAVFAAAVCCVLDFDLLGVEERVPKIREVEEVTFYAAGNNYTFYPGQEDELLEQVRAVHLAIAQDAEYAARAYDERGIDNQHAVTNVRLTYRLRNGTTLSRRYSLVVYPDRIDDPATYDFALDRLVNGSEMKAKRLHDDNSGFAVVSGNLYVEKGQEGFSLSDREARALWEALCLDAKAGTWGTYDWFGRSNGTEYAISLSLEFVKNAVDENNVDYTRHDYLDLNIRPGMSNTVGALLALELVTPEQLVTYVQLYPERYEGTGAKDEMAELMEKYGIAYEDIYDMTSYDPNSAPRVEEIISGAVSESSSIGIIGGADGPTAVYVTGG